jgi:hypothetical protein
MPPDQEWAGSACHRGEPGLHLTTGANAIASLTPAEKRFVGAALACIYAEDTLNGDPAVSSMLARLPTEKRSKLGRAILDRLADHAARCGDWTVWAETCWAVALPGLREAGAPFRAKLDASARRRLQHRPDPRRQELARTALRLLRRGTTGRILLTELRQLNSGFDQPLPADAISSVAIWAARALRGQTRA